MRSLQKASLVACTTLVALGATACDNTEENSAQTGSVAPATSSASSTLAATQGDPSTGTQPSDGSSTAADATASPAGAPAGQSSPSTGQAPADSANSPDGDQNLCGTMTGDQALQKWVSQVPPSESGAWDTAQASTDSYDPCKALSWITLSVGGATGSSPFQVMLFHNGSYVGTATAKAYSFTNVSSLADDRIQIQYRYLKPGDSNANPTGSTTAEFSWSEDAHRVEMTGQVPPV